jgi:cytochrome P450
MSAVPVSNSGVSIAIQKPGFFNQPDYYDVLARLRAEAPVFNSEPNTWLVSRYADIRAISRDTDHFCSSKGVLINDPARTGKGPAGSILHMDPPEHAEYRRVVSREFTPRSTGAMEDAITRIVTDVFDGFGPGDEIDFVHQIAMPIPVRVIADLLGVADTELDDFRRWSDAMIEVTDNPTPEAFASAGEFWGFLQERIAERRANPGDDLISMLAATDLDDNAVLLFCLSLLVAGNETTRHLISMGTHALHAHPDQRAAMINGDINAGVEELLRWVTPIQAFGRTATQPVTVNGVDIPAGDFVVMLYASGNRDEDVFGPTADTLDVTRPPSPTHVAFGFGEHNCLGAPLARSEARIAFSELLRRFPDYDVVDGPELTNSTLVRGASSMKVVLK